MIILSLTSLTKGLLGYSGPRFFLYTLLNCLIFYSYIFVRLHWIYRYLLSLYFFPLRHQVEISGQIFVAVLAQIHYYHLRKNKHFLRYIFISSLTISYMHTMHFLINSSFLIDWCSRVYFHRILSVPHGPCTAPLHLEPWHRNDVKVPCVSYSVPHTYSPSLELLMPCR